MTVLTGILLALPMLATAGCNAVEGAGKDIEGARQAIERAPAKAKPN
jgi:predicted small secreted protein